MTKHMTEILKDTSDLSLPDWGPYSKRFFGISHIADSRHGDRFDFFAAPSLYRHRPAIPDALRSCGYLPSEVSADLNYYSYHQDLEWEDRVSADVSFFRVKENVRLFRCELVNNSDVNLDFSLHMLSALSVNPGEKFRLCHADENNWLDALDYSELLFEDSYYGLRRDAMRRGEERNGEAIGGSCLGQNFGLKTGDSVTYLLPRTLKNFTVYLRYRLNGVLNVKINGKKITLQGDGQWEIRPFTGISGKTLTLISEGGVSIQLDGFAFGKSPSVESTEGKNVPEILPSSAPNSVILRFAGIKPCYGILWSGSASFSRKYEVKSINHSFLYEFSVNDPTAPTYENKTGDDCAYDIVLQPLSIPSRSKKSFYAFLMSGTPEDIRKEFATLPPPDKAACDKIYHREKRRCVPLPADTPYTFSQERIKAVTMTNIVYPIYAKKQYIRHHTPGRCWDSLYTWDSGFIGLGLLELEPKLAAENLRAYTVNYDDSENAFVHRGTFMPMQIILYHELINRSNSPEWENFFYKRVKKIYDFLLGHDPASCTREFSRAGFISPWKYAYNSGGWDDYPAQKYVHRNQATHILPVISTAIAIRVAKILSHRAENLKLEDDVAVYEKDVAELTEALQKYSWNEESGFFSYMVHDAKGNVQKRFMTEDGTDYNMGLDGASPLIADAVTGEQRKCLWKKLFSPKHFYTSCGISTVDLEAPYFRPDGYANGSNWTSFEYFLWKSALDCGQLDDAWKIASTGLKLWQGETELFQSCFEHFSVSSGRGTGWHHFSSFSTPYMIWFHAYFVLRHLTVGFDTIILKQNFSSQGFRAVMKIFGTPRKFSGAIVTLPPGKYSAYWNGKKIPFIQRNQNAIELKLPCCTDGVLEVQV